MGAGVRGGGGWSKLPSLPWGPLEVGWEASVSPVTRAHSFKAGPVGCELHKCVQGFTLLRWDWIAQGAVDGDCPSPGQ